MSLDTVPVRAASMQRIPSLDGLRAISIFLVLALHTIQRIEVTHPLSWMWVGIFDGATGVYIFFVISGYLITSLLLHEFQTRGSISLRGFYFRRAMRILPPLYVYIGVIFLLGLAGRLVMYKLDFISAIFFFHDYAPSFMWPLEHFWSLSIEEQFYLIWPFILLYCLHRSVPRGRLAAAKIAIAIILISPVIRVVSFVHLQSSFLQYFRNGYAFHMRADLLMFGCLIALLQGNPSFERFYKIATKIWWIPPAIILLSDCVTARFLNHWDLPFGASITGSTICIFLLWCVRNPRSVVGRVLNSALMTHIGILSYSIYIWQTLFLNPGNVNTFGPSLKFLYTLPFSWLVIFLVAELSYNLVEKPSLQLRNRLIKRFHLYRTKRHADKISIPASSA